MLSAKHVNKSYGGQQVLKNFCVDLSPGEIVSLVGPSGSGKSTALRLLAFLEDADDESTISLDEQILMEDGKRSAKIDGIWPTITAVFQQLFLWPNLTLRENIALGARDNDISGWGETLESMSDSFQLAGLLNRYPNQVSIGQRQRAAIIRALILQPRYLLLDEVTSALDVEHVGNFLQMIVALKQKGMGILLVTHLLGFAKKASDKVLFMDHGEIAESGSSDILVSPSSERLKKFVGLVDLAH